MFRLRMLGQMDLRDPEGREVTAVLVQPKRLALLAYLAMTGAAGFQRRDLLLALFCVSHQTKVPVPGTRMPSVLPIPLARYASGKPVLRLVLREGVVVAMIGLVAGIAPALSRTVATLLYGLRRLMR